MKITHYSNPTRNLNGTFTKKRMSSTMKLFIVDVITIIVMAVLIVNYFTPKPVQAQNIQTVTIHDNQNLQNQVNVLIKELQQERNTSLN